MALPIVHVRLYHRFRLGKSETVRHHWRRPWGSLNR